MVAPSRTDAATACTHPLADDAEVGTPLARPRSPGRPGVRGASPGRPAAICSPIARLHLVPMPPCCACRLSPAPISRRASRFHLPPALRWRAPFGVRRFDPAGWAAATVAAVVAAAAAAARPTLAAHAAAHAVAILASCARGGHGAAALAKHAVCRAAGVPAARILSKKSMSTFAEV